MMEKPSAGSGILSRSRAKTAPNGGQPHSEDDSSEEEHSHDSMIRVGTNYQAVIPECKPESPARYSNKELKGMLVWSPNHCVSDAKREWGGILGSCIPLGAGGLVLLSAAGQLFSEVG